MIVRSFLPAGFLPDGFEELPDVLKDDEGRSETFDDDDDEEDDHDDDEYDDSGDDADDDDADYLNDLHLTTIISSLLTWLCLVRTSLVSIFRIIINVAINV